MKAATEELKAGGLRYGRDDSGYNWVSSMPARDVLAGADTIDRMNAEIARVAVLCERSGIFDALAARTPLTNAGLPDDPATDE